eukprot:12358463-Karenia_brevis.AAC.1
MGPVAHRTQWTSPWGKFWARVIASASSTAPPSMIAKTFATRAFSVLGYKSQLVELWQGFQNSERA